MSFELRVVQEFLLAAFDWADKHALAVRHLVLSERAVIWELLEAILNMTLVYALARLQIVELVVVLRVVRCVVIHEVELVNTWRDTVYWCERIDLLLNLRFLC